MGIHFTMMLTTCGERAPHHNYSGSRDNLRVWKSKKFIKTSSVGDLYHGTPREKMTIYFLLQENYLCNKHESNVLHILGFGSVA